MGAVYRATDTTTGEPVALKLLLPGSADILRFEREAQFLEELEHPAIVRYVAHGQCDTGEPFVATELLEGPSLLEYLAQSGPLSVEAAVTMTRRIADALGYLHERGVLHRDLKPANLILVSSDPAQVKLVDFGVARRTVPSTTIVTETGKLLGTVGYMAPEQARGEIALDGRLDLFALGCVLFEALAGAAPFMAKNAVALLAKLLLDEAPPLRSFRSDIPDDLHWLIASLLAKAAEDRPATARSVVQSLDALGPLSSRRPEGPNEYVLPVRTDELRMTTVAMLGSPPVDPASSRRRDDMIGYEEPSPELLEIVREHEVELTPLADGTAVLGFPTYTNPADRAERAAACVLALRRAFPTRPLALATGRSLSGEQSGIGPALEQAGALLKLARESGAVALDELTAGLIRARFDVERDDDRYTLLAERPADRANPLRQRVVGREVPFVGRRSELALLEATLDAAVEEEALQILLLTGPAGAGKSRLAAEFVEQLSGRDVRTLLIRATPARIEASGSLLRALLRSAAQIPEASAHGEAWARLQHYVEKLDLTEPARACEILGELIGVPSPDAPSVILQAAREDPKVLRYWLSQILVEWAQAESRERPFLLVLEDAHWADAATLAALESVLQELPEAKVFLLLLARPEVHRRFDALLRRLPLQEVSLSALSRQASETLVRAVLPELPSARLDAIVERAAGNAFFLEELTRAVAKGRETLPETVLAIAEENIDLLDAEARRVLRAASVFGPSCRAEGVARLLGESDIASVNEILDNLVEEGMFIRGGAFDEPEDVYTFRHILLRDAAYEMLPPRERTSAHASTARWLEERGEIEPGVLAEHWSHAGADDRATPYFALAAKIANASGDGAACISLAQRGLALEPSAEIRGRLLLELGYAYGYVGQFNEAMESLDEAIPLLPERSDPWILAVGGLAYCYAFTAEAVGMRQTIALFGDPTTGLEPSGPVANLLNTLAVSVIVGAGRQASLPYWHSLQEMDRAAGETSPVIRGWARFCSAIYTFSGADLARGHHDLVASSQAFGTAGDPMGLYYCGGVAAWASAELGLHPLAAHFSHIIRELSRRGGLQHMIDYVDLADALVALRSSPDESYATIQRVVERGALDARCHAAPLSASIALSRGDLDCARTVCERLEAGAIVSVQTTIPVVRARLALAEGKLDEASAHLKASEPKGEDETILFSVARARDMLRVRLHDAKDEHELAKEAAAAAKARLEESASALQPSDREAFWKNGFAVAEDLALLDGVLTR